MQTEEVITNGYCKYLLSTCMMAFLSTENDTYHFKLEMFYLCGTSFHFVCILNCIHTNRYHKHLPILFHCTASCVHIGHQCLPLLIKIKSNDTNESKIPFMFQTAFLKIFFNS